MSRPLTGYALTSHFRKLRARYTFTHLQSYLFLELVSCCNDVDWAEEFSVSNTWLCNALVCTEPALIKARAVLEHAGLLTYVSGNRRAPTRYRLRPDGCAKGLTEFSQTTPKAGDGLIEGLTKGLTEFSPYKEQTKTKRKEEKESAADAAAPAAAPSENSSLSLPTTEPQPRPKSPRKTGATAAQLAALPLPHPSDEFAQLWATFRESPKQVGKALSAFELMLKKLSKYPEGFAIVMLERAIQGGWSGVENPGTAQGFAEWQATQRRQPAPVVAPLPIPCPELNQDFVAQLAAQEAARQAQHLARYAVAA
jgi:hypothetical protein